ncbi:heme exporter protein CcmD [Rivibacter subsaxonicus]|uniref:Heme exporter protein D n=1 Tax=Rivibacter subsaxonicus TaxID=457575 RepID=A0A4V2FUS0_9BURK|nr:heme exporter protein CcmD [Rivibacter subsaxonicus]RZU03086.1 heme exporter protein D [Rivibacter subsaxonicus]
MNWNSWSDFFAMGGYGVYVWGSFGVTALLMAGEVVLLAARRRALLRTAAIEHEH